MQKQCLVETETISCVLGTYGPIRLQLIDRHRPIGFLQPESGSRLAAGCDKDFQASGFIFNDFMDQTGQLLRAVEAGPLQRDNAPYSGLMVL